MTNRTSLDLGDIYETAKQNCNGNLSEYLRNLVKEDDQKLEHQKKICNMTELLQLLSFLFLGILFFILAINITIDLPTIVQISIFIFAGILLMILSILTIRTKYKFKKGVVEKWK